MKDINQKEKINTAKSVSFENQDGKKISLYAGAANFGLPLNLGLKVIQNKLHNKDVLCLYYMFIFCLGFSSYCYCKSCQRL